MQFPKIERLAVICRHPVQYYAPLFKLMAKQQNIMVFYHNQALQSRFDKGFGRRITWDIPLLEGYTYTFSHRLKDIQDYRPTAILIYGWAHTSHLRIIFHFTRQLPLFFRGDSTLLDATTRYRTIMKSYLLEIIYSKIDYALYVGTNNKAYFEKYRLNIKQLIYARHAVDNDRFAANRSMEAAKVRAALGVSRNEILVLFAGKLIPKKGPGMLLKAFGRLKIPGVHLLLVGDGILEATLKQTATTQNNWKYIHFLPFQNQQRMPVLYQSCDLFCMPSIGPGETWGLAINEAMAAGKAILASDKVGGAVDLIDERNGQLFTSGDLQDLSRKLKMMVTNQPMLKNMGRASAEKIKGWNFQHQIDAIYGTSE